MTVSLPARSRPGSAGLTSVEWSRLAAGRSTGRRDVIGQRHDGGVGWGSYKNINQQLLEVEIENRKRIWLIV